MVKPELLAPAGGERALIAAVQSGADAVYAGGPKFNARRSADNFSVEDIKKYAEYCHLYGVDFHVAVNTLIKEKELDLLYDYAYELNDAGVDALIVQDIGAAKMLHKIIPDMPLHASTQMTVTDLNGVKYLEDMGFSRVVLARELSRKEIEYISSRTKTEVEIFVHGALCMCYSGQCLMSSILGGRSGNRGCCAQPCRLPYKITNNGSEGITGYFLSPKDLALINELGAVEEMGIASLKIEGRLKRAEYVSAVTGIYRKYIDNPGEVLQADMLELQDAFSRSGFTDGYFGNKLGKGMMSHKNPGNMSENKFTDEAKRRADENANIRKIKVNISAVLLQGQPPEITMYDNDGNYATVSGDICAEAAENKPLDEERIKCQLLKLGSTPFEAGEIFVTVEGGITLPIKELNSVRRKAAEELILKRSKRIRGKKESIQGVQKTVSRSGMPELSAEVRNISQAKAAAECGIKTIYIPSEIVKEAEMLDGDFEIVEMTGDIFDGRKAVSERVTVSSGAAVEFYKDKIQYGGFRLNIFNSETAEHFSMLERITLSPELNIAEIRELLKHTSAKTEIIGYGRLPLMMMKNCPLKAAGKCQNGEWKYRLKDRKNEEFPIMCTAGCKAVLLNSKPVYIADKINDFRGIDFIKLVFTDESYEKTAEIADKYKAALNGARVDKPEENTFTRGHFYRGVM